MVLFIDGIGKWSGENEESFDLVFSDDSRKCLLVERVLWTFPFVTDWFKRDNRKWGVLTGTCVWSKRIFLISIRRKIL